MNNNCESHQIEIPLSKIKMGLLCFAGVIFVALGLFLIVHEPKSINYSNRFSWIMRPIPRVLSGILFVIFFGFAATILFIRLFTKNQGLLINEKGIIDNSSFAGLGFIPWKDVKDIKTIKVNSGNFIIVLLNNPSYYINSTTHYLKRRLLKNNFNYYETPILISANSLKINHKKLYELLLSEMKHHKFE